MPLLRWDLKLCVARHADSSVVEEELELQRQIMAGICLRLADFHNLTQSTGSRQDAKENLMVNEHVLLFLMNKPILLLRVTVRSCHRLPQHPVYQMEDYRDALVAHPMGTDAMLCLARLHLKRGELDLCVSQCETTLRACERHKLAADADSSYVDPFTGSGNRGALGRKSEQGPREEAVLMLADVAFARKEVDGAMSHLSDLLGTQPRHYDALARLLQLLWRSGRLDGEGPQLLRAAEADSPRAFADPGLSYCKGLFHRLAHDPHAALRHLNKARRDGEWGPAALSLMITVYIEPFLEATFDLASAGSGGIGGGEDDDESGGGDMKKRGGNKGKRGLGAGRGTELNDAESAAIAAHLLGELAVRTSLCGSSARWLMHAVSLLYPPGP